MVYKKDESITDHGEAKQMRQQFLVLMIFIGERQAELDLFLFILIWILMFEQYRPNFLFLRVFVRVYEEILHYCTVSNGGAFISFVSEDE